MPIQWIESVKQKGQLSVYAGPSVTGNQLWSIAVDDALFYFNELSQKWNCGVTLVQATKPPHPDGVSGADIQIEAANGQVNYWFQETLSSTTINGNIMTAVKRPVARLVAGAEARLYKAFIFLPATPRVEAGGTGREVGRTPRSTMVLHELLHAAGLINDHSPLSNADLLCPGLKLEQGETPADDKIIIPNGIKLPPFWISRDTAQKIANVWRQ